MKFKELKTGEVFCFSSEKSWWSNGIAKGPWVKISPRKYMLECLRGLRYTHQVGSINVKVEKQIFSP